MYNGVLLLNKPNGITSHDAVTHVRRVIHQRRIGHTGTLDPRAEGLLVVCVGKATKVVQFLTDWDKSYDADIQLGQRSRTYDSEGIYHDQPPRLAPDMSPKEMTDFLKQYTGVIKQRVPAYSAVKVNGERLYERARRGEEFETPERDVDIKKIQLLEYRNPILKIRVTCGKGTYIRTLADDIGNKLGCGAYLSRLLRLSVGKFRIDDALSPEAVEQFHEKGTLHKYMLPYGNVLEFPAIVVVDEFQEWAVSGKDVKSKHVTAIEGAFSIGDKILLKDQQGEVLAVGTAQVASGEWQSPTVDSIFKYVRVLN
jgi:tRNA pseudouridine55 synthase